MRLTFGAKFVQLPTCTFLLSAVLNAKKDAFDATEVSDAELRDFVEALAQQRKDMVNLESEYLLEVAAALGADRALMLPDMQRHLVRKIRERVGAGLKGPSGLR